MKRFFLNVALVTSLVASLGAKAETEYQKLLREEKDVLKWKLFPKANRVELSVLDGGVIMNQAYVFSYVGHGALTYFFSEKWGISLEGLLSQNSDKEERYCIEHFFNNPNKAQLNPCLSEADGDPESYIKSHPLPSGANFGPAYTSIRELDQIFTLSGVWTPFYGKQLFFLAGTVYLDLFFTFGAGLAYSTYYPTQTKLKGLDKLARSETFQGTPDGVDPCSKDVAGVCTTDPKVDWTQYIGEKGRPDAQKEQNSTLTLGVGQKIHFFERYAFKLEIRNYTLLQTEAGYDTFFMLWAGLGARI